MYLQVQNAGRGRRTWQSAPLVARISAKVCKLAVGIDHVCCLLLRRAERSPGDRRVGSVQGGGISLWRERAESREQRETGAMAINSGRELGGRRGGFGVERKIARDDAHSNVAGRAWLGELP